MRRFCAASKKIRRSHGIWSNAICRRCCASRAANTSAYKARSCTATCKAGTSHTGCIASSRIEAASRPASITSPRGTPGALPSRRLFPTLWRNTRLLRGAGSHEAVAPSLRPAQRVRHTPGKARGVVGGAGLGDDPYPVSASIRVRSSILCARDAEPRNCSGSVGPDEPS